MQSAALTEYVCEAIEMVPQTVVVSSEIETLLVIIRDAIRSSSYSSYSGSLVTSGAVVVVASF